MGNERIEINPRVCNGKPVIKGTRIPVTVLLDQLAVSESWDAVKQAFPKLTTEDIKAALLYAKTSIDQTTLVSSATS